MYCTIVTETERKSSWLVSYGEVFYLSKSGQSFNAVSLRWDFTVVNCSSEKLVNSFHVQYLKVRCAFDRKVENLTTCLQDGKVFTGSLSQTVSSRHCNSCFVL